MTMVDGRYAATASHSHLFAGATIAVEGASGLVDGGTLTEPIGLRITFADGATANAELLVQVDTDEAAVEVDAYVTAAGTALPARTWRIVNAARRDSVAELRVGRRLGTSAT